MSFSVLAVDIGTTRTKYRFDGPPSSSVDEWTLTGSPHEVLNLIKRLRTRHRPEITVMSAYRRAALDTRARPILVRDLEGVPPTVEYRGTDSANPFATLHRWKSMEPGWFSFDAWLSYSLTGRLTVAPSMAWLSGTWNLDSRRFDDDVLGMLVESDRLPELPEVLGAPELQDGVLLPIFGDHEATAVSAVARRGELNVVECGTAWASLVQTGDELSPALGLDAPLHVGYRETIDPFLVRHLMRSDKLTDGLGWIQSATKMDGDVVEGLASFHLAQASGLTTKPVVVGGNAEAFLSRLDERVRCGFELVAEGISPVDGLIRLARRALC